jgi:hypothetical protein
MVTTVPTGPDVGEKLVRVGASRTTKGSRLIAVPPEPVTLIGPVVAPAGTVAVIWVGLLTVNVAATPPKRTAETSTKPLPVIVTTVPTGPEVGEKPVTMGVSRTTNGLLLVAVPPGVITLIGPVVAPAGTVAVICVGLLTVNVAGTPPNRTPVTSKKFEPKMVTEVPTGPEVGVKLEMKGGRGSAAGEADAKASCTPTHRVTNRKTNPQNQSAASLLGENINST